MTGGWRVDRPAEGPALRHLVSAIQTFHLSQVVTHPSLGNTLTSMARLHFAALLVAAALVVASGANFCSVHVWALDLCLFEGSRARA